MKLLEKALFELIKNLAGSDTKVYALRAPKDAPGPFIIFQRVDSSRFRSINNPSGVAQATIQIDCYAREYYAAKEMGLTMENLLDGYMGVVYYGDDSPSEFVDIAGISLQGDADILDDTDEPFLYRSTNSYLITYYQ